MEQRKQELARIEQLLREAESRAIPDSKKMAIDKDCSYSSDTIRRINVGIKRDVRRNNAELAAALEELAQRTGDCY